MAKKRVSRRLPMVFSRVPRELHTELEAVAQRRGLGISDATRLAVLEFVKRERSVIGG